MSVLPGAYQIQEASQEASISVISISRLLNPHAVAIDLILFSIKVFDCLI
jgi:hypothetical protein